MMNVVYSSNEPLHSSPSLMLRTWPSSNPLHTSGSSVRLSKTSAFISSSTPSPMFIASTCSSVLPPFADALSISCARSLWPGDQQSRGQFSAPLDARTSLVSWLRYVAVFGLSRVEPRRFMLGSDFIEKRVYLNYH
jgi:hypothetical protein